MRTLRASIVLLTVAACAAAQASAQALLNTVPIGAHATAVAVNPATNKAYAVGGLGNTLVEIDGLTGAKVTIPLQATSDVAHAEVAVNPRTNTIYVVNVVSNNLAVINGATRAVSFVPLGAMTYSLALNITTNTIFVTHYDAHYVSIIDGATKHVDTVAVGINPSSVAVNEKTNRIYVANNNSNTVSVINGATQGVVHVPTGTYPDGIAVDVKGGWIYVTNILGNSVTAIDGTTNLTQTIPMPPGRFPFRLALNPTTARLYVSFQVSGSLAVVNTKTKTLLQMVDTGGAEGNLVVDPWRNRLYTADFLNNRLMAMDLTTFARTTAASQAQHLWQVAFNPLTNVVYGANLTGDSVSIFSGAPGAIPWATLKTFKLY